MHQIVIFVAKYFIVFSALLAVWVFINQPKPLKKTFLVIAVPGAVLTLLLAFVGKHLYYDPRPFVSGHIVPYFSHSPDNGFPSDHTLLASFLAFLCLPFSRKFGWTLVVLALLIGLSRVQAGVHHLNDIAGSFVFAAIGVSIAVMVEQRFDRKKTRLR